MTEAWSSLLQTLTWAALVVGLIYAYRGRAGIILDALIQRIEAGSALAIGPVNIGSPPPAIRQGSTREATSEGSEGVQTKEEVEQALLQRTYPEGLSEDVYLVHNAQVITPRTAGRAGHYRVRVTVEADDDALLDDITRVTYRLHDTFPRKVIATEARQSDFELWLNVYGEFTMVAHAERQEKPALWLTRYLDLPGRPPD